MVTCKNPFQRKLYTWVGFLCGRANTCGKKVNYKRQESAAKAAAQYGGKRGREFDAYQCAFCRGWHIGGSLHLTLLKTLRIILFYFIVKVAKEEPSDVEG